MGRVQGVAQRAGGGRERQADHHEGDEEELGHADSRGPGDRVPPARADRRRPAPEAQDEGGHRQVQDDGDPSSRAEPAVAGPAVSGAAADRPIAAGPAVVGPVSAGRPVLARVEVHLAPDEAAERPEAQDRQDARHRHVLGEVAAGGLGGAEGVAGVVGDEGEVEAARPHQSRRGGDGQEDDGARQAGAQGAARPGDVQGRAGRGHALKYGSGGVRRTVFSPPARAPRLRR